MLGHIESIFLGSKTGDGSEGLIWGRVLYLPKGYQRLHPENPIPLLDRDLHHFKSRVETEALIFIDLGSFLFFV